MSSTERNQDSNIAIEADSLSKCYRIYDSPRDRLLQGAWGRDWRGRPKRFYREFWALKDLSFQLERGQTLGIVGKNGSGKSTLLQLLCGTLQPSHGKVHVTGRIGALLELGSGFNPEFNGIENIYLNAAVLGLKKSETEERLDKILAFADIGDFIHQPVKTYSSGMAVRLAFAVQAHIDPEILIVDEALAVGDELFQKKCYDHLSRLKDQGTAVLLVTHSCPQIIQHCDQALLLHKGRAHMLSEPARVTVTYQRLLNASDAEWEEYFRANATKESENLNTTTLLKAGQRSNQAIAQPKDSEESAKLSEEYWLDHSLTPKSTEVYPSRGARIEDIWIESVSGIRANTFSFGSHFNVMFSYAADVSLERIGLACHLASHTGLRISGQTVPDCLGPLPGCNIELIKAGTRWQVSYKFNGGLWPGIYFIGGGIINCSDGATNFIHRVIDYKAIRIMEKNPLSVVGASSLRAEPPSISGLQMGLQHTPSETIGI